MSRTYAVPDIHGRIDLLDAAISVITRHSATDTATVVTLGDYVDRGPHSMQVLDRLINWRPSGLKVVNLKGNHEAMMEAVCKRSAEFGWWEGNGGNATLLSYGSAGGENNLQTIPPAHLQWVSHLPLMHIDRHRVFVHAAVDAGVPLEHQNEETLLWRRYPSGADVGHGRRHVVHGHHSNDRAPVAGKHKTNLDGGAWKTGRLVVGVFENDHAGGASDYLEIIGPPARH